MADNRRPTRPRRETSPATLELLRRAQDGDRDAFGRLYADHLDIVTCYVPVRLRDCDCDCDWDAIPDAVHHAFTDALTELPSAPQDAAGWFLQPAACACTRHGWAARRYLRAAHEIHDHLTDNQRTAIQLHYLDGYPRDLTAATLSRSTAAIKDLQRRGLRRLNSALAMPMADATAVAR